MNLAAHALMDELKLSKIGDSDDGLPTDPVELQRYMETMQEIRGSETAAFVLSVRSLVKAIRSSPQRRAAYLEKCRALGLPEVNIILDVATRWNSTFDMLERAFQQRKALEAVCLSDSKLRGHLITEDQWEGIQDILELLGVCCLHFLRHRVVKLTERPF